MPDLFLRKSLQAAALSLTSLLAVVAKAEPPPGSSGKYHDYFNHLYFPGTKDDCCGTADCRSVDTKFVDGQWWAYIDDKTFGEGKETPNAWIIIPESAFVDESPPYPRPPLKATVCWFARAPVCFDKPQIGG